MAVECRKCGCKHVPVRWTRKTPRGITRGRVCRHCNYRFTTREIVDLTDGEKKK